MSPTRCLFLVLVGCGHGVERDDLALGDGQDWGPSAKADTVCASGGSYTTIQSAINAAAAGSSITICAGTFKERLTISKSLTLDGAGATTILDANKSGSAITLTGGATLTVKDMTIKNARTAGISCSSSTLSVSSVTFSSNKASSNGGGIYASSCALTVSGSSFSSNSTSGKGGAIYGTSSSGTIGSSSFTSNKSSSKGGAVALIGGTVTVTGNTFTTNVGSSGGAVYLEADNDVTNNTFSGNTVTYHGGGIYSESGDGDYTGNSFTDNYAGEDGGGVYVNTSYAYIADNDFVGNDALDDAGALRALSSFATIENNYLEANTAGDTGGAVKISHKYGTFTDNVLVDNVAVSTGGGLYLDEDTTVVDGCTFEGNSAAIGGGMYQSSGWRVTEVSDSSFVDNTASSYGGGLAVSLSPYGVHTARVEFDGNTAAYGAGVYADQSALELENTVMHWNTASTAGGGLYASSGDTSVLNAVFYRNGAPSGAGIYASALTGDGVRNTQLYRQATGYAVTVASGTLGWEYNNSYLNTVGNFSGMSDPVGTSGNTSALPYFYDSNNGDFHIYTKSPGYNGGDPDSAYNDTDGSRNDMGIYGGPNGSW